MKFAIIGNQPDASFRDLERACGGQHTVTFVSWQDLHASLGQREFAGWTRGDSPDAWIVRSMPSGSLEQVIFQMNLLARIEACGGYVINSARSLEIAIDKYLSLAILRSAGVPVPPTVVCQQVDQALKAFEKLGGDVVIKPVFGGEGRGIIRVSDGELAGRAFRAIVATGGILYLQSYLHHGGCDYRLFVVGDQVTAMKRDNPIDFRTNAARGARCSAWSPSEEQVQLAKLAATAAGLEIAGVDLVQTTSGLHYVLEVNGVPGWRKLAEVTGDDIASKIVRHIENQFRANQEYRSAEKTITDLPRSRTRSS
jgi:RimK family alpha-L-glutamate ligase